MFRKISAHGRKQYGIYHYIYESFIYFSRNILYRTQFILLSRCSIRESTRR